MPTTSPATARCVLAANDVHACAFMHGREGVLLYAGVSLQCYMCSLLHCLQQAGPVLPCENCRGLQSFFWALMCMLIGNMQIAWCCQRRP